MDWLRFSGVAHELILAATPFAVPAFGAIIGLRWSEGASRRDRVYSVLSSWLLGIILGDAVVEMWGFGPKLGAAARFMIAIVGTEFLALVFALAREFRADPYAAARRWRDLILFGRGNQP